MRLREYQFWQASHIVGAVVVFAIIVGIWAHAPWVPTVWTLLAFLFLGGWAAWATIVLKFNKVDDRNPVHRNG